MKRSLSIGIIGATAIFVAGKFYLKDSDLSETHGEANNLSDPYPEIVRQLKGELEIW